MSTSDITADEYRTAAKVDRHHGGQSTAQFYEDNARALEVAEADEAESFEFLNELALAFRSGEKHARPHYVPVLEGVRAVLAHLNAVGRLIPATAEPVTGDLAAELAEVAHEVTRHTKLPVQKVWAHLYEGTRRERIAETRAVLAHLQSTGRLIPAGGMALTAEQVEDVRLLAQMCPWWSAEHVEQVQARVRSMLPATEPAEERRSFPTIQDVPNNTLFHTHGGNGSSLFVRNQSGDLRLRLNAGPEWSKLMREEDFLPSSGPFMEVPWPELPQPPADPFAQPAPAEPAEEETKAERGPEWFREIADAVDEIEKIPGMYHSMTLRSWAGVFRNHADTLELASSPVVPAPTETGPHIGGAWLTDGETKDAEMILRMVSINRHFSEWARNRCREISTTLAPFVAAEEG